MQKIVTVTIDTTQLSPGKINPFAVNELDEINEILELGWQIEEWDFLREGETDGQVVLIVILNDDMMFDEDNEEDSMIFNNSLDDEDEEEYEQDIKENKI